MGSSSFYLFLEFYHHFFPVNRSLLHIEPEVLVCRLIHSWDVLEGLVEGSFDTELDGTFLGVDHHPN